MTKLLTEIIGPSGMESKRLSVENDFIVVRRKTKKNPIPYRAKFNKNCIIPYKTTIFGIPFFKRNKQKLMLIDGADECVSFKIDPETKLAQVDLPIWDRISEEKLFQAGTIEASSKVAMELKVPSLLYVALIISICFSGLTLLVASGRLKL